MGPGIWTEVLWKSSNRSYLLNLLSFVLFLKLVGNKRVRIILRIKVCMESHANYLPVSSSEHRAVMEAAFVYGTSYQFALTTEFALLENIGYV